MTQSPEQVHLHVAEDSAWDMKGHLVVKGVEHQGEIHGQTINPEDEHERLVSLEMPEGMARRLTQFVDRFLVDPKPDDWVNCHRFAVWMTTGEMPEDPNYPRGSHASDHPAVEKVVKEGVKTGGPLEMGQHAVVAQRSWRSDEPILPAEHSVIGLGPTEDEGLECIQINDMGGKLTLSKATRYMDEKMKLGIGGHRDLYAMSDHNDQS